MISIVPMHMRKPALAVLLALVGGVASFSAVSTLTAGAPALLARTPSTAPSSAAAPPRAAPAAPAPAIAGRVADGVSTPGSCPPAPVCDPPAPPAVLLAECCKKGTASYEGKYPFCYCLPDKFASVCKLGAGHEAYPILREDAWCTTLSTHPYWPKRKISCLTQ